MFLKHSFSCFVGILGTFNFLVKEGAKNFGRVAKGGEFFGILRENKGTHIKMFA